MSNLRYLWTNNQNKLSLGYTREGTQASLIEDLAIGRIRWASMCNALEVLFMDIENHVKAYKKYEEEEKKEDRKNE